MPRQCLALSKTRFVLYWGVATVFMFGAIGFKGTLYDVYCPPRADAVISGLTDVWEQQDCAYFEYNNPAAFVPIGPKTSMPVGARRLTVTLWGASFDFWVTHLAGRVTLPSNGIPTMDLTNTHVARFQARYNDLHPDWQALDEGADYRGDPDTKSVTDDDCNTDDPAVVTHYWSGFEGCEWRGPNWVKATPSIDWGPASA